MKTKIIVLIMTLVLFGCGEAKVMEQDMTVDEPILETMVIGGKEWKVEIADTPEERRQGLMNRKSLPEGQGMLFVFDQPGKHQFWMKNTLIPLDIVWLDEDMEVLESKFAPPCHPQTVDCPVYVPEQKAHYVLEVNAGEFYRE